MRTRNALTARYSFVRERCGRTSSLTNRNAGHTQMKLKESSRAAQFYQQAADALQKVNPTGM